MRNDDNESSSAHLTAFGNANESQRRRRCRLRSLVACYFNAGSDRDRDDVGNGGASCKVYYANALNGTSSSSSSSSGAQCSRPHTPHSRRNALQCSSSRRSRSSSSRSGSVGCSSAVVCVLSLSHSLVAALIGVVAVCAVATFTFTSFSSLRRSRSCSRRCRRCTRCALHTAVLVGQVPAKLAFSRNATFASCGCPAATVQSAPRAAEQTMTTRQRRQRRRMTKGEDGSEEATLASHLQAVESGCSAETVDSSRDVGRGQCQWQRCRSLRSVAQTHSLTVHAHCDKTRNHRVKLCQVSKINSKEHFDSFL